MAGGIYGTDPEHLSLRATLPRFLDMELEGSLIHGLAQRAQAGAAKAAGARYGLFISFDAGIGLLPETLAQSLDECIRLNTPIASIVKSGAGFDVDGQPFDAVILATTAHKAAGLLPDNYSEVRASLESIPFGSGAIVTFAFDRDEIPHALDAAGFVVPAIEGLTLMASTWSSLKWPGRAPKGKVLLRAFMGGYHMPDVPTWDDARLVQAARDDFEVLMGITASPQLVRVDRWVEMMPRYFVGHAKRMDALDEAMGGHDGLELAGNAYRGVGIPDSIASGEAAAARLLTR
jgi:oxygen-dependent protoporphyrinogen oxidase